MIDVHVHLAAFPVEGNGCFMSPKIKTSLLFRFLYKRLGVDPNEPERSNRDYIEKLIRTLQESRHVKQAAILAMDGVYDAQGSLNKEETDFLISNNYVLDTAARYPELFKAGVSINPKRRDAMEELDRCVARGAYLVKMLPNAQAFNPADPAIVPYWKRMAHHKIPLLSHVGFEFSLIGSDQSVGDPIRLIPALESGVTVIAAHGASYGLVFYEKYWQTFQDLVKKYPNFYWDASALSLWNRAGMLLRIRKHPELHQRMVFGTDYPLPSFAFPALLAGKPGAYLELLRIKNPFDRHYRLLELLGLPISRPSFL